MDKTIIKDTEIQQIKTIEQIRSCYIVMRQLRPHLTEERSFIEQVQRQLAEGYTLASWLEKGEIRALIGFRFLEFLAWGS
ncbi:MAG: hypothetical protein JSS09_00740 [Verrucomicrobia bacterium]|nr:hypothetical protein [Verrucomicrobiota bacterium]